MALDVYKDWLGIPDGPRPPDHYQLLRVVQFEDEIDKINRNYKKLNGHVRKYATGQYMVQSQDLLNELAKAKLCLTDPLRKRDYDESLGREFPEELDAFGRRPMENILREQEHLSREQVREVQEFAEARGLSIRDAVVQMKLVDAETAQQALAQELGLSYIDLEDVYPDDSVLDKVPRSLVRRQKLLPLFVDDDTLLVACIDEPSPELEDELRLRFEMPIKFVIATPLAINQGISKYYAPGMRDESAAETAGASGKKTTKKAAPKTAKKRQSQLTEDEKAKRKQIGMIIMLQSFVLSGLVDQFLLPHSWTHWGPSFLPFLTALIVPPIAVAWVLLVYWK